MRHRNVKPEAAASEPKPADVSNSFVNEATLLKTVLPISRRTCANWRNEGKLPYVKIGGRVLYDPPSVRAALLRLQRGGVA